MFDYQRTFHVGVLVPDVDAAMAEYGAAQGVRWATVQHSDARSVWTPERGVEQVSLTFVYSCDGPHRIELLRGSDGSVWDCGDRPGLHHVGVWSDDVAGETAEAVAAGWRVAAAAKPPEEGYGTFTYIVPPSGLIVELVSASAKPRFEQWWSGGTLGSDR